MDEVLIILVRGVGLGSIYALVAMSLNVVSSSCGVINFAQGNLLVVAASVGALSLPLSPPIWLWLALLGVTGVVLMALLSGQGAITLLPLRSSVEQHSWLVTTLAASVIIGAIILIVQGSTPLHAPAPFPNFRIVGTRTPSAYAILFGLALFWCAALYWFHTRTVTGLSMQAIAQDLDAARALGLRVRRLQIYSFAVSGLMVGTTGFAAAPVISISNDSGIGYVLNGFVAAVIGGIGSNAGALLGGLLVGVISMYAAFEYGGEFQNAIALLLLVGILMLRPQGLFGRTSARRV